MGSPISSILAEICIHYIEQTHILNEQNNKFANKILYWYRYDDDILLLYNGSSRQTKQLHQYINKLHEKLNFTLETEVNNSMNLLDLTITKTDTFNIYRKPTTTQHIKSPYSTQTCSIPFHGQQTPQRTLETN